MANSNGNGRVRSAELHPGPGFRVEIQITRTAPELIAELSMFPTADISDQLNRLFTMGPYIRSLTPPELPLAGPAVTVKVFPGDNLMVHKALDVVQPGDIVVVDASSSTMTAVLGDMVATKARHRGIRGFVVDGLVRDLPGILALGDLPVFARGSTPIGPLHRGPGEINHPVNCGGVVVMPGDVVLGDADGVVVVPRLVAPTVLGALRDAAPDAAEYASCVARGVFSNDWVDAALMQGGLELPKAGSPPQRPA